MTTQQMIDFAAKYFTENYPGADEAEHTVSCYAKEELGMDKDAARGYGDDVLYNRHLERNPEEYNRFYTWYYVNMILGEIVEKIDKNTIYAWEPALDGDQVEVAIMGDYDSSDDEGEGEVTRYKGWYELLRAATDSKKVDGQKMG